MLLRLRGTTELKEQWTPVCWQQAIQHNKIQGWRSLQKVITVLIIRGSQEMPLCVVQLGA